MSSAGKSNNQELACLQTEFVNGIEALDNVVNVLSSTDSSWLAGTKKNGEQITRLSSSIRQAHQHLTTALELCQSNNDRTNREIESKVNEIGKTQNDLSSKQREYAALTQKLQSINEQISSNEKQLSEAQDSVNRAADRLREQESKLDKRKTEQAVTTGVGVGLFAIPVVGWIAGAATLAVSFTALEDAVKAARNSVESAESDKRSCQDRLSSKVDEKRDLEGQLARENTEKSKAETKLETTKAELKQLENDRDSLVVVQQKLRETCHFMSKIWGKSNVLMVGSQNMYSLEPLFVPLIEISGMLTLDEQSKLRVRTILFNDRSVCAGMASKMKAICENLANSELDLV